MIRCFGVDVRKSPGGTGGEIGDPMIKRAFVLKSVMSFMAVSLLTVAASTAWADTIHENVTYNGAVTWSASDNDHIVIGSVHIGASGSLTIQDGCNVRFEHAAYIDVYGTPPAGRILHNGDVLKDQFFL